MGITAAFMLPHPPLIIPEVGRGEEKKIQKTIDAYHQAAKTIGAHKIIFIFHRERLRKEISDHSEPDR